MKHQKGMKKGFSLAMSEVDHKATLWVRDLSQVIINPLLKSFLGFDKLNLGCSENSPWNCYWVMPDKTCLDLMVGLGNKYPKQLLNSAVHTVRFSDSPQSNIMG
jgi:hypothetical protein